MFELNNSGQTGTATLTGIGVNTQVVLSLNPGALNSELVHIHRGQCGDGLGGVNFGLNSFIGGSGGSSTMVGATLAILRDGDHAINIHMAGNPGFYTACGDIPLAGEDQPLPVMAAGPPGPSGPAGPRGAGGLAGPAGLDGARGVSGAAGPAGFDGRDGAAGAAGQDGADGRDGIKGDTGDPGPAGADGSAGGGER